MSFWDIVLTAGFRLAVASRERRLKNEEWGRGGGEELRVQEFFGSSLHPMSLEAQRSPDPELS